MPGLKINGKIINNLRYADDTVLLAESEHELQSLIDQVNKSSNEYGLDINIQKTKTMIISKDTEEQEPNINIHGEKLQQVKHYQYLGHIVTNDGRCETEVKWRIGMA